MKVKIKFQLGSSLMEFPAPFPLINCNYSFFHLNISSIFYSGTVSSDDRHLVLSRLLNSCFLFNRWGTRYLETSRKYRFCLRPHKCALLLNHVTMTQHFHFSISCGFLLFYHISFQLLSGVVIKLSAYLWLSVAMLHLDTLLLWSFQNVSICWFFETIFHYKESDPLDLSTIMISR
jgi:hypothetical protein